jgi:hypothetical protein
MKDSQTPKTPIMVPSSKPAENDLAPLADAIRKLSDGTQAMLRSGLKEKAVIILLHDATRIAKRDIEAILAGLKNLKNWYCT